MLNLPLDSVGVTCAWNSSQSGTAVSGTATRGGGPCLILGPHLHSLGAGQRLASPAVLPLSRRQPDAPRRRDGRALAVGRVALERRDQRGVEVQVLRRIVRLGVLRPHHVAASRQWEPCTCVRGQREPRRRIVFTEIARPIAPEKTAKENRTYGRYRPSVCPARDPSLTCVLHGPAESDQRRRELVAHVQVVARRVLGRLIPQPEAVVALVETNLRQGRPIRSHQYSVMQTATNENAGTHSRP
jgi:hypothetical protein